MSNVDPWGSWAVKNYDKLVEEFGMKSFSKKMNLDHLIFERNIVWSHRDFDKVFKRIKDKKDFINITGIATTGHLHFGHKLILDIFKLFKDFGGKNYFALSDIDSYTSRPKIKNMGEAKGYAVETAAHALAMGLAPKDIYIQSMEKSRYYEFTFEISKKITQNMYKAIYGNLDLGKISAVLLQISDILHPQLDEYAGRMPSITVIGAEQDPHARLTRDIARKFGLEIPSFLYIRHQSGLQAGKKMSASEPWTAIFLNDKPDEAKRKILNSFTGGGGSLKEHREKGGNPDVCKVYELLKYHYPDTKKLEEMYKECKSGKLMCGDCKKVCINFIQKFLEEHQKKYEKNLPVAEKIVYG